MWQQFIDWLLRQIDRFDINDILGRLGGQTIGTFLFLLFGAIFVFLGGRWLVERLRDGLRSRMVRPLAGNRPGVVVALLDGPEGRELSRRVLASLEQQFAVAGEERHIDVIAYPQRLVLRDPHRSQELLAAQAVGRRWLSRLNADLLIWGEVVGRTEDPVIELRFLLRDLPVGSKPISYLLTETWTLQRDFRDDLAAVLSALVVTNLAPAYRLGQFVADVLEPALKRVRPLAQSPPADWPPTWRRHALHAYAVATARLGLETGKTEALAEAASLFREVLKTIDVHKEPVTWATTQVNLATISFSLAESENNPAQLREVIDLYRGALQHITSSTGPMEWAALQTNLGNALRELGEREGDLQPLRASVDAHREALKIYTRKEAPLYWAAAQNNLGIALQTLGECLRDSSVIRSAIAAFEQALQERTRQIAPVHWGVTLVNMTTAYLRIGELDGNPEWFARAEGTCRRALDELTEARAPPEWAMAMNTLAAALTKLGELEPGVARLNEAAAAHRATLRQYKGQTAPVEWAMTQHNLAGVLARVGDRTAALDTLREAVSRFKEALKVRTKDAMPEDWAVTKKGLGTALAMLGWRERNIETLGAARAPLLEAIEMFHARGLLFQVEQTHAILAHLERRMSELLAAETR